LKNGGRGGPDEMVSKKTDANAFFPSGLGS
jgi:hypothetical protein